MIDLLAFGLLVFLVYRGSQRGTASMALSLGGLLGGYLAAVLFFRPVGGILGAVFDLPRFLSLAAGGALTMLLVMGAIRFRGFRMDRDRKERIANGWQPRQNDVLGGAALGLIFGLGSILLLGWAASSLGGITGRVDTKRSVVAKASSDVVETVVRVSAMKASGDEMVASSMAYLIADPSGGTEVLNQILNDERVREMVQDSALVLAVVEGRSDVLARDYRIRSLAEDWDFMRAVRRIGLVPSGSGPVDPSELSRRVVDHVGPMIRTVRALAQDPEVLAAVRSPEVSAALDGGNLLALAKEEKLQELFDRVLEELRSQY